jgi:hypothetical protein
MGEGGAQEEQGHLLLRQPARLGDSSSVVRAPAALRGEKERRLEAEAGLAAVRTELSVTSARGSCTHCAVGV